jgi:MraZ protein
LSDRELYYGYGLSPIDGKDRVAIPPTLRAAIAVNSSESILLLSQHDRDPCLVGFDKRWLDELNHQVRHDESLAIGAGLGFDRSNAMRRAFTAVEQFPFDGSGRFVLKGFLRDDMNLKDYAFFAGVGAMFEIWDPATLLASASVDDRVKRACRWHLQQKGVAA